MNDFLTTLLSGAGSAVSTDLKSSLPSKQTVVESYMGAIIAFWVVGGLTLWAVNELSKPKRR